MGSHQDNQIKVECQHFSDHISPFQTFHFLQANEGRFSGLLIKPNKINSETLNTMIGPYINGQGFNSKIIVFEFAID
jgi:hypothetical protein